MNYFVFQRIDPPFIHHIHDNDKQHGNGDGGKHIFVIFWHIQGCCFGKDENTLEQCPRATITMDNYLTTTGQIPDNGLTKIGHQM